METVITAVVDEYPKFLNSRRRVLVFRVAVCAAGFLLGLPMVTQVTRLPQLYSPLDCIIKLVGQIQGCWPFRWYEQPHWQNNPTYITNMNGVTGWLIG